MQRGSLVSSPPLKGMPGSLRKLLRLSFPDGSRALFCTLPLVLYSATTRLIISNSTSGLPAIEASCPTHRPWSGGWTRTPAILVVSRPLRPLKLCSSAGSLPLCTGRPLAPGALFEFDLPKWLGAAWTVCDAVGGEPCTPSRRGWG